MTRLLLLPLLLLSFLSSGAAIQLSPRATVTVLTCSPGTELYSVFGHSALRVTDPGRFDVVFNYGTFEFSDDFYVKFARGKLNYRLSRSSYSDFQYEYIVTGRSIDEQVLDLTLEQRQRIFDFLEENHLPENRFYLYDFFYDNCATRIRDVLNETLGNELVYHSSFAEDSATFRMMIDAYLEPMVWSDFGIDMVLGLPCDDKLQAQENMFLPDFVHSELATATLKGKPLVKENRELLPREVEAEMPAADWPAVLCGLLTLLAIGHTLKYRISGKAGYVVPRLILGVTGLLGVVVFLLWFFTDHSTTKLNFNILWAFPLHLIWVFIVHKESKWRRAYFRTFALINLIFLLTGTFWPQEFHNAAYELSVATLAICLRLGFDASGKNE